MNFKFLSNLTLKYDKKDFLDLYAIANPIAILQLEAKKEWMGKLANCSMKINEGIFSSNGQNYNCEFLGLVSPEEGKWFTPEAEPDIANAHKQMGIKVKNFLEIPKSFEVDVRDFAQQGPSITDLNHGPFKELPEDWAKVFQVFAQENVAVVNMKHGQYIIFLLIKDIPLQFFPNLKAGQIKYYFENHLSGDLKQFDKEIVKHTELAVHSFLLFNDWQISKEGSKNIAIKNGEKLVFFYDNNLQVWKYEL